MISKVIVGLVSLIMMSKGTFMRPKEIGGTITPVTKVPFVVAVVHCVDKSCNMRCTGSLVAPNVVLTAAHCVKPIFSTFGTDYVSFDKSELFVVAGTSSHFQAMWSQDSFKVGVKSISAGTFGKSIVYPYDGDIMLLELDACLSASASIGFAKMATRQTEPEPGNCSNVTIAGFGDVSNAPDLIKDYDGLLRVSIEKQHTPTVCRDAYTATTYYKDLPDYETAAKSVANAITEEAFVCAGGTTWRSVCHGDSGGPMYAPLPTGQQQIIGVTSFMFAPGFCGVGPSYSSRVAFFASWAAAQINTYAQCPGWSVADSFASWPLSSWSLSDLSDEYRTTRCLSPTQWQCKSGACIGLAQVCDGHVDCGDGSDENFTKGGVSLCKSSTKASEIPVVRSAALRASADCVSANSTLTAAIAAAQKLSTIDDIWDASPLTAACNRVNDTCVEFPTQQSSDFCTQLKNYVYWNATTLESSRTFGTRFGASCPDDKYLEPPRTVSTGGSGVISLYLTIVTLAVALVLN